MMSIKVTPKVLMKMKIMKISHEGSVMNKIDQLRKLECWRKNFAYFVPKLL